MLKGRHKIKLYHINLRPSAKGIRAYVFVSKHGHRSVFFLPCHHCHNVTISLYGFSRLVSFQFVSPQGASLSSRLRFRYFAFVIFFFKSNVACLFCGCFCLCFLCFLVVSLCLLCFFLVFFHMLVIGPGISVVFLFFLVFPCF